MRSDGVTMEGLYPDALQVFTEAEVAAIVPPAGVTNVFPYAFVIRNADPDATTRALPSAASSPNQFDGVFTVTSRIPLQATPTDDVFTLSYLMMAVVDSETRMTESIEEGQDTSAVRRLRERAAALGATTVTVLAGSTAAGADVADYLGQRQICTVRTAGTAASPVTTITTPGAYARIEMLRPGESTSACGAGFRSGTASTPALNTVYPVTVKAMDRYGNVLTATADTVAVSQISGPAATFGAAAPLVSGQATVNVTWQAAGSSVLAATGRRVRSRRTITVPATATITLNTGDNQAAMAGTAVPTAPSVVVRDLGGTPLAGVPVTFTVTSGGGGVTGATATTNASGVATLGSWTMGATGALNTLSASTPRAFTPVSFRASGCSGGGGTGYAITLCYTTTMTAPQRAAFDSAAARWSRVITGDLAGVSVSAPVGACTTNSPAFNLSVDDLVIFAAVEPIDGPGAILGAASYCGVRTSGGLPFAGFMQFDAADMAYMEGNGLITGVILHEMGHVIGIGTRWSAFGLLQNPSGATPLDTYFSGSNAITGFNNIGGSTYTGGNKVPVENTGGAGTANAHWRESVLANELMTGWANVGSMPLSQLTARSLADMGYAVNVAAADPFFLTLSLRGDGAPAPGSVPLGNDVLQLPLFTVDPQGNISRVR
ncbi:MAG TPA: leishmanolysin-related zinc metalloendopeptidase [Longimicrobium sp.]|nr:leishmanolysin-related zinc metalloendopeptidase [Longimicrobium sp.]